MGNEGSKGGPQADLDAQVLNQLTENTHWSDEELKKFFEEYKELAKTNGGLDQKQFAKAAEKIGLLRNVDNMARPTVDKGGGKTVTMHMNKSEVKKDVIDVLWRVFDADRNGRIDFQELVIGASVLMKGTIDQKARALFNLHDANGDGTLTKEELQNSIKRTMKAGRRIIKASMKQLEDDLGKEHAERTKKVSDSMMQEKFVKSVVTKIFDEADVDGNGAISVDEFVAFARKNPDILKSLLQITGEAIPPPAAEEK